MTWTRCRVARCFLNGFELFRMKEVDILCLEEVQVNDVADALLLRRLFEPILTPAHAYVEKPEGLQTEAETGQQGNKRA